MSRRTLTSSIPGMRNTTCLRATSASFARVSSSIHTSGETQKPPGTAAPRRLCVGNGLRDLLCGRADYKRTERGCASSKGKVCGYLSRFCSCAWPAWAAEGSSKITEPTWPICSSAGRESCARRGGRSSYCATRRSTLRTWAITSRSRLQNPDRSRTRRTAISWSPGKHLVARAITTDSCSCRCGCTSGRSAEALPKSSCARTASMSTWSTCAKGRRAAVRLVRRHCHEHQPAATFDLQDDLTAGRDPVQQDAQAVQTTHRDAVAGMNHVSGHQGVVDIGFRPPRGDEDT